jgi:hypothetical protein
LANTTVGPQEQADKHQKKIADHHAEKAAEHHEKAAKHYEEAAQHHREAPSNRKTEIMKGRDIMPTLLTGIIWMLPAIQRKLQNIMRSGTTRGRRLRRYDTRREPLASGD